VYLIVEIKINKLQSFIILSNMNMQNKMVNKVAQ